MAIKPGRSIQASPADYIKNRELFTSGEYTLSIQDVCDTLKVQRAYFNNAIRQNVANIWVSKKLWSECGKTREERDNRAQYRFSARDLSRWFNENSVFTRRTIAVSLLPYAHDPEQLKSEIAVINRNTEGLQKIEISHRKMDVYRGLLNDEGLQWLGLMVGQARRNARAVLLEDEAVDLSRQKIYKIRDLNKHDEKAYRQAYRLGMKEVKLNNSLKYFLPGENQYGNFDFTYSVSVPYETYCKIKNIPYKLYEPQQDETV